MPGAITIRPRSQRSASPPRRRRSGAGRASARLTLRHGARRPDVAGPPAQSRARPRPGRRGRSGPASGRRRRRRSRAAISSPEASTTPVARPSRGRDRARPRRRSGSRLRRRERPPRAPPPGRRVRRGRRRSGRPRRRRCRPSRSGSTAAVPADHGPIARVVDAPGRERRRGARRSRTPRPRSRRWPSAGRAGPTAAVARAEAAERAPEPQAGQRVARHPATSTSGGVDASELGQEPAERTRPAGRTRRTRSASCGRPGLEPVGRRARRRPRA